MCAEGVASCESAEVKAGLVALKGHWLQLWSRWVKRQMCAVGQNGGGITLPVERNRLRRYRHHGTPCAGLQGVLFSCSRACF